MVPGEEEAGEPGGAGEDPSPAELAGQPPGGAGDAAQRIRSDRLAKYAFIQECKHWIGGEPRIMQWATAVLRFLRRARGAHWPPEFPRLKERLPL